MNVTEFMADGLYKVWITETERRMGIIRKKRELLPIFYIKENVSWFGERYKCNVPRQVSIASWNSINDLTGAWLLS